MAFMPTGPFIPLNMWVTGSTKLRQGVSHFYNRRYTYDGRRRTEDGGQKTEDGRRNTDDGKKIMSERITLTWFFLNERPILL